MVKRISEPATHRRPKVSVAMITYNHERFIAQAIESVLHQQVDFEIELVIGEDCSGDGTRPLVQAYASKYPNVIRALLPEKNRGMQKNFAGVMDACGGDFIAILEGDDYWTDRQKLARQAEFLEANPDCTLCFHNAASFQDECPGAGSELDWNKNGKRPMCGPATPPRFSQKDFFEGLKVPTCSVMFRREAVGKLPAWFETLTIGDLPLFVLCTEHGQAAYLPAVMAAYRVHPGGTWSGSSCLHKISRRLKALEALEQYLQSRPPTALIQASRKAAARTISKHRSKLELTQARLWLDGSRKYVPQALWRAWRLYPREPKWLLCWLLFVWPHALGGKSTSAYVDRKLRERF